VILFPCEIVTKEPRPQYWGYANKVCLANMTLEKPTHCVSSRGIQLIFCIRVNAAFQIEILWSEKKDSLTLASKYCMGNDDFDLQMGAVQPSRHFSPH
jgi:hypothetical protein